jgi:hypothetical protein
MAPALRGTTAPLGPPLETSIFVGKGLDELKPFKDCISENNVFLAGAKKSKWGDQTSVESPMVPIVTRTESPNGMKIEFTLDQATADATGPWVDAKLIGVLEPSGQTIEDLFSSSCYWHCFDRFHKIVCS